MCERERKRWDSLTQTTSFPALCSCKFPENWLLAGGNLDFILVLQIQNISSKTRSDHWNVRTPPDETGALELTVIFSEMSQPWSFFHLWWSFSICHRHLHRHPQHHLLVPLWANYVFGSLVHSPQGRNEVLEVWKWNITV